MSNAFRPAPMLLAKLGTLLHHYERQTGEETTIHKLLHDPDVREWMAQMRNLNMVPLNVLSSAKTHE